VPLNVAILLAAGAAIACDSPPGAAAAAPAAKASLERGAYLVDAVMACDNCHTPRRPDGALDMERRFSGGSEVWDTPAFRVEGSNITPDVETGIGSWSDEDLKCGSRRKCPIISTGS
jgi:hypothetical protein